MYALRVVIVHRESLSIRYTQHHIVRDSTRSGCTRIIQGRSERTIALIEFKEQRLQLYVTIAVMVYAARNNEHDYLDYGYASFNIYIYVGSETYTSQPRRILMFVEG